MYFFFILIFGYLFVMEENKVVFLMVFCKVLGLIC